MPSSDRLKVAIALCLAIAGTARAQTQQPQGFALDRYYPSAPGGGWLVMDSLEMHGGIGGALSLTLGYSSKALRVTDGVNHLSVVSDQAFANIGAALTYDRFRLYLDLATPLVSSGQSGTVGDYSFTAPALDLGTNPDTLSDARIGLDVRIFGRPGGRFRFGAGAQLFVPSGDRGAYVTDGTFRGMIRALFAGDWRWLTWAAQLGVHLRPLDDAPAPGSPHGSELLFGVAAGARLSITRDDKWAIVFGPELFGATAFRSLFDSNYTALEALLSARVEQVAQSGPRFRVKLGAGAGLDTRFGAPEWRLVASIELFGNTVR